MKHVVNGCLVVCLFALFLSFSVNSNMYQGLFLQIITYCDIFKLHHFTRYTSQYMKSPYKHFRPQEGIRASKKSDKF